MRKLTVVLSALVIFAFASPGDAATLYGATGGTTASNLYIVNPATAATTVVGAMPVALTALAYNPVDGLLYGATSAQSPLCAACLVRVNPATAAVTTIGSSDVLADLAFRADGTLFAWIGQTNSLVTVNLTTGATTAVGSTGLVGFGNALEFTSGGTLYAFPEGDAQPYYTVNPATAAITPAGTVSPTPVSVACSGFAALNAGTIDPSTGTFYVSRLDNCGPKPGGGYTTDLLTVNLATGAATRVGLLPSGFDALAFVPSGDVGVTKTAPSTGFASLPIQYTITVTNNGPGLATNVTLTDAVPANTTFGSIAQTSGPLFNCSGTTTITCTAASMPNGASATFLMTVNTSAATPAGTVITNIANVAMSGDTNSANNSATATTTLAAASAIPAVDARMLLLLAIAVAAIAMCAMKR